MWQCSQCKKDYEVDFESGGAIDLCPDCHKKQRMPQIPADFFATPHPTPVSHFWGVGFGVGIILLLVQIYLVERDKIGQDAEKRASVEKICQLLPCRLPVYKNLDEIEILQGDFQLEGNSHYVFETVISNQAAFSQAYPRIKLILLDFSGQPFAQRIFHPKDYVKVSPDALMAASQTIEISLNIAIPRQKIGGYTFELI